MSAQGKQTEERSERITFAPACVGNFDLVKFKLEYLQELLNEDSIEARRQRKNIEYLINYYKNGGKPPEPSQIIWLVDGVVVDEMPRGSTGEAIWREAVCFPLPTLISVTFAHSIFV